MKIFLKPLLCLTILTFLSACGSDSKTAMVTLKTGFETQVSSKNLMKGLVHPWSLNSKVGANFCKQNDVLAGFAPSSVSGNDGNVSFFKVALATTAANTFGANPDSWLATNSDFPPIGIPAPVGVPLDFGILGSLIAPTNTGLAGEICPTTDSGPINTTYSMIGHAQALISGNTVVPIKVWILQSNSGAPLNPGGACDSTNGGDGTLAQSCPNKNYFYVKTNSGTGFNQAVLTYGFGNNGNAPIKQTVTSTAITGGIRIPEIKPLTINFYNSGSAVGNTITITKATLNNGITSPIDIGLAGPTLEVSEGGGVTPPGTTNLNHIVTGPVAGVYTVTLNWGNASLANGYSINRYASDCASSSVGVGTTSNLTVVDTVSVSATYCYKITATGPGGVGQPTYSVFSVP